MGVGSEFEGIMKLKFYFICSICLLSTLLLSTTWHIKQDGTGNFTTIQQGINASVNGDTIRVYPGTYFENLFVDKSISLVSNYEFTGNEQDIHSTILDGDYQSSVIRLEGEEYNSINVYICGFVIQHGSGWHANTYSFPLKQGGGIRSRYVNLILKKNTIKNNRAFSGGGLALMDTYTNLVGNLITKNLAYNGGGGIILVSSNIVFDADNLNNIYLNYAGRGNDIFINITDCPTIDVVVDTFTVAEPNFYSICTFVYPGFYSPNGITYNIQHGKIEQVEHDLYVSTDGDDNNSGLTADEPLQNIHFALTMTKADSLHHRTVHVADGLYSPSLNEQYFPLHMKSYVSVIGESRDNTILDAELGMSHIYARDYLGTNEEFLQRDYSVKNLKLINGYYRPSVYIQKNDNVFLENTEISNYEIHLTALIRSLYTHINMDKIYVHDMQGGRACYIDGANGYTVNLTNFKIDDNYPPEDPEAPLGCGFMISNNATMSQPDYVANIINAQITNNINHGTDWPNPESAIKVFQWGKVNLINSTISNNESYTGGAVVVQYESELHIYNSILCGDVPREIVLDGANGHTNTLSVQNSLIEGGLDEVLSIGYNIINWADNNLDEDPLFVGAGDNPYTLSESSPCIDAGTLDLPEGVVLPAYDLAGNPRICGSAIDMGCYEFPDIAAPINVAVNNGTLTWSIPAGNFPDSYKIYLDDELQETVNSNVTEYTFSGLIDGQTYFAGISAVYGEDETAIISVEFVYEVVSVSENIQSSIFNIQLSNYPNPFNPNTTIKLDIAEPGKVELAIYNIKGQKVVNLMDAYSCKGHFEIVWRGMDENGKPVSSGVYFYQLVTEKKTITKKMILIK